MSDVTAQEKTNEPGQLLPGLAAAGIVAPDDGLESMARYAAARGGDRG